jgi:hypothetical protein
MEAPRVIKLLGSDIKIELQENVKVDGSEAMGTYDQEQSLILIKDNMSISSTRDTVMHEVLHAILQHYEVDSEKTVRILTPAIISVLRDNPALVTFITGGTEYPFVLGPSPLLRQEY